MAERFNKAVKFAPIILVGAIGVACLWAIFFVLVQTTCNELFPYCR